MSTKDRSIWATNLASDSETIAVDGTVLTQCLMWSCSVEEVLVDIVEVGKVYIVPPFSTPVPWLQWWRCRSGCLGQREMGCFSPTQWHCGGGVRKHHNSRRWEIPTKNWGVEKGKEVIGHCWEEPSSCSWACGEHNKPGGEEHLPQ